MKQCHGYRGQEFLSAKARSGKYGGEFENRKGFLREIVEGIKREAPGLLIGVRLSAFDALPFRMGASGKGEPEDFVGSYPFAFGADPSNPLAIDLTETYQFLDLLLELGIPLVCISCGSPYYNPHIQRPTSFLPSAGYHPPDQPPLRHHLIISVTTT